MFKQSFISLYFTSKKLQIVKIDRKSRRLIKAFSYPIPAGVIVSHQVVKNEELTKHIREALQQAGVKDKSVGLVVPEYSTYTKLLSLPKLSGAELDEAVRWHSQDFLPTGSAEMVMDWKVVKEGETEVSVLAVAIVKASLLGYVDAASAAGLMPLAVETPSLSLTRISEDDDGGKLIVYVSVDEAILILSRGQSILTSSVAAVTSQNEIIQTGWRMMSHYSNVSIEKIYVGGAQLSSEFYTSIQNYLKKPVVKIEPVFPGMTPEQVGEYLIPLSLQLKNPEQPEDEASINLLPYEWVKHYKKKLTEVWYWTLTLMGSFVVWIGVLAVTISYMLIVRQLADYETKVVQAKNSTAQEVYDEVSRINTTAEKVISVNSSIAYPQEIINKVAAARPAEVRISYYKVDMDAKTAIVSGTSGNRSSLITFKQALENIPEFREVTLPISSLVAETDQNFDISFSFGTIEKKSVPKLKLQ